jgi:hypothetical protein
MIFNSENNGRKLDELKNINTRVFLMCCPGLYLILSGGFFIAQARLHNDFRWQKIFLA